MRLCFLRFDLCLLAVCQLIIALISDIIWVNDRESFGWKDCGKRRTSGTIGMLLSVDFKATYSFEKITESFNTYCNISSYFSNRFGIDHHQDIVSGEIYDQSLFIFNTQRLKRIMLVARLFLQPQLILRTEHSLPHLLKFFLRSQNVSYGEQSVSVIKTNYQDIIKCKVFFIFPILAEMGICRLCRSPKYGNFT
jgi:hypothetical protein